MGQDFLAVLLSGCFLVSFAIHYRKLVGIIRDHPSLFNSPARDDPSFPLYPYLAAFVTLIFLPLSVPVLLINVLRQPAGESKHVFWVALVLTVRHALIAAALFAILNAVSPSMTPV